MAKKQTRRSISISGATYNALSTYCEVNDVSRSGVVERLINKWLNHFERTHDQIPIGQGMGSWLEKHCAKTGENPDEFAEKILIEWLDEEDQRQEEAAKKVRLERIGKIMGRRAG